MGVLAFALTLAGSLYATQSLLLAVFAKPNFANRSVEAARGQARVLDGDSLEVGGIKVRLEGIDAPELAQTCRRMRLGDDDQAATAERWACGKAARRQLLALIGGQEVSCAGRGTDGYGRLLGVCAVAGVEINRHMVSSGWAWAFTRYAKRYVALEAAARAGRRGIWSGEAEPAWAWRARRWQMAASTQRGVTPWGCVIKGNITRRGRRVYHVPWGRWYDHTRIDKARGERWFCNEAEALAAGWRPALDRAAAAR